MSSKVEYLDLDNVIRLGGSLRAPLATAGDVATVQADGSVAWQPNTAGGVQTPILPSGGDDTAALNAALAVAGHYLLGPGTFHVTGALAGVAGTTIELHPDTVIDATGMPDGSVLLTFAGTEAAQVLLTVDAAAGATSVSVAGGAEAGFAAGDYVRVGSTAKWTPNAVADGSMDQRIGEIIRVASTAAGVVNFQDALQDSYAVADSAFLSKLTLADSITIAGKGKIIGKGSGLVDGLNFDRCLNVTVTGVRMYNFDDAAILLPDTVQWLVDDIHVEGGSSAAGTFYGVTPQWASQDGELRSSHFESCRHAFTTSGNLSRSGITRRIVVGGNVSLNAHAAAFDTHAGADGVTFAFNRAVDPVGAAVQVRSPRATVIGNVGIRPGDSGIYLRNQSNRSTAYTVVGNTIRNGAAIGILYRTPPEAVLAGTTAGNSVDSAVIEGNTIVDSAQAAISCQSAAGFPNLVGCQVVGNRVRWTVLSAQIGLQFVRITDGVMHGNVVVNAATGLSWDDNCATCVHGGNVLTTCTTRRVIGAGAGNYGDAPGVVATCFAPLGRAGTLAYPTANQAQYYRVWGRGRISKIAVHVGVQSGNLCVAVYRNKNTGNSAVPDVQLATSGSVACPAPGYAEIALGSTVEVEPGDWIGLSADNTTVTLSEAFGGGQTSNLGAGQRYTQAAAHPLPNPPSSLAAFTGNTYLLLGVP